MSDHYLYGPITPELVAAARAILHLKATPEQRELVNQYGMPSENPLVIMARVGRLLEKQIEKLEAELLDSAEDWAFCGLDPSKAAPVLARVEGYRTALRKIADAGTVGSPDLGITDMMQIAADAIAR